MFLASRNWQAKSSSRGRSRVLFEAGLADFHAHRDAVLVKPALLSLLSFWQNC